MKTDVLIIGGGVAGLTAALAVPPALSVTLLQTGRGASPYIHGVSIPVSQEDSVDRFVSDTLAAGYGLSDLPLVKKVCAASLDLPNYFSDMGIQYDAQNLLRALGSSCPRVVSIEAGAIEKLRQKLSARDNFCELSGVRALELNVSDCVHGAFCYDVTAHRSLNISAQAVILAGGGFSGIFGFSTNSADIGGDMPAMAYKAGASLCDMEFIQFEPSAAVYPLELRGKSVITTMLFEGAVLKNGFGEEFVQDYASVDKETLSRVIAREIKSGRGTENGGVYYDAAPLGKMRLHEAYESYLKRYKAYGIDIAQEAMEIAPAPHTTLGGIKISETCSASLPGLFACGEAAGGLHGAGRLGGNAGLAAFALGRIAGESAGKYVLGTSCPIRGRSSESLEFQTDDFSEKRKQFETIASRSLGIERDGSSLKEALFIFSETLRELRKFRSYAGLRLYNDVLTANLAAKAAFERRGSVGCHFRTDYPAGEDPYKIEITRGECDEKSHCSKRPIC